MKLFYTLMFIFIVSCASETTSSKKTEKSPEQHLPEGMSAEAPSETLQYAFKLGTWNLKTKYMTGPNSYGTGSSHVYFGSDGMTYIEEMVLEFGGGYVSKSKATFKYDIYLKKWVNTYNEEGKPVTHFNAEVRNGVMVEYLDGQDNYGEFHTEFEYLNITEKNYSYKERRVYKVTSNEIMGWYFDATQVK